MVGKQGTPMQIIIRPADGESGSESISVDTTSQATPSALVSAYCAKKGVPFNSRLALFHNDTPLPPYQSLQRLGLANGDNLTIGYPKTTIGGQWPLLAAILALLCGVVCLIAVSTIYGTTGNAYPHDFGVVMDAGSSKTNTLLYTWTNPKLNGTGCVSQVDNCFAKGGIAKMDPTKLDVVIDCAKNITRKIDDDSLSKTPLYFAATAGMRLLNLTNPGRVNQILVNVRDQLDDTGLSVRDIGIISGEDEGTYGWIAANYLQQTLEVPQELNPWVPTTYGALDMGGASMQIAFAVPTSKPDGSVEDLELYGQTHHVFSYSNLCFGRDEAERRYRYFLVEKDLMKTTVLDPCLPSDFSLDITAEELLMQPCIENEKLSRMIRNNPEIKEFNYTFQGISSPALCKGNVSLLLDQDKCKEHGFKECFKILDKNPSNQKYLAFASYYFTTNFLNATKSTLKEYEDATRKYCAKSYEEVIKILNSTFATQYCFNAEYIHEALTNGFHFTRETWTNVEFVGNIDGKDVGWTLGYMIKATNLIPSKAKAPGMISSAAFGICLAIFIIVIFITGFFIKHLLLAASSALAGLPEGSTSRVGQGTSHASLATSVSNRTAPKSLHPSRSRPCWTPLVSAHYAAVRQSLGFTHLQRSSTHHVVAIASLHVGKMLVLIV